MNENTIFLRELNARPIALYPIYIDYTGSVTAGLLLSQIMFYFSSFKKDLFFKTDDEIRKETRLSISELRSAKAILRKTPFLTISIKGVPAKTFYELDWQKYYETMSNFSQADSRISQNNFSDNHKSSLVKFTKQYELNSLNSDSEIHETNMNNNFNTDYNIDYTQNNITQARIFDDIKKQKNLSLKENPQIENFDEEKNSKEQSNSKKKFIKPTLEDLNSYKQEKDLIVDCESFYDYYEAKGWLIGRSPMKDWRATMRNWSRNQELFKPPKQQIEKNYEDEYEWR